MLFNKVSGGAEKGTIDGKPATEKMEFEKETIRIDCDYFLDNSGTWGKVAQISPSKYAWVLPDYTAYHSYLNILKPSINKDGSNFVFDTLENRYEHYYSNITSGFKDNTFYRVSNNKTIYKSKYVEAEHSLIETKLHDFSVNIYNIIYSIKENKIYAHTYNETKGIDLYCYDINKNEETKLIEYKFDGTKYGVKEMFFYNKNIMIPLATSKGELYIKDESLIEFDLEKKSVKKYPGIKEKFESLSNVYYPGGNGRYGADYSRIYYYQDKDGTIKMYSWGSDRPGTSNETVFKGKWNLETDAFEIGQTKEYLTSFIERCYFFPNSELFVTDGGSGVYDRGMTFFVESYFKKEQ